MLHIKRISTRQIFFCAKRKACFDYFVLLKVLLHNLKLRCSKQRDKDTLFDSREKIRLVENRPYVIILSVIIMN